MFQVAAQLLDLQRPNVLDVHESDGRQVSLGPLQLPDGHAEDLPPLVGGPRFWKVQDGIPHASKLGATSLDLRLAEA